MESEDETMRRRKGIIFTALVVMVLAAGLMVAAWILAPRPERFISATGYVTTLEEYHFTTNRVEYRYPKPRFFEQWLPKGILKRYEQAATKRFFVKPGAVGEPIFSAAFTVRVPKETSGWVGRMVVADEDGNEFDPVGQTAGNFGDDPAFEVFDATVFPRRGKKLKLKLKTDAETVAEFVIPNPARGEYPQWKANELPMSANAGDLKVKLVEFVSEQSKEFSGEDFSKTSCVFELMQGGAATTNWIPLCAELSDATGNRWQPFWYRERVRYVDGKLKVALMGALWAGEEAWRLKVDFQQQAGFTEDELVRWEGLEVPTGVEVVRPRVVHDEEGRVELLGVFGPSADREAARKIFLNINPRRDAVTIALRLGLAEFDRTFSLLGIYDENDRPLEVLEVSRGPQKKEHERYLPLLVHFKTGADVKRVSMVFALPKSRRVEFLAKPVQK